MSSIHFIAETGMTCVIVGNHDFPPLSLRAEYLEDDATRTRRGSGASFGT
jgi:hypothetical protein